MSLNELGKKSQATIILNNFINKFRNRNKEYTFSLVSDVDVKLFINYLAIFNISSVSCRPFLKNRMKQLFCMHLQRC